MAYLGYHPRGTLYCQPLHRSILRGAWAGSYVAFHALPDANTDGTSFSARMKAILGDEAAMCVACGEIMGKQRGREHDQGGRGYLSYEALLQRPDVSIVERTPLISHPRGDVSASIPRVSTYAYLASTRFQCKPSASLQSRSSSTEHLVSESIVDHRQSTATH